ncbi:dienelactone hydrolase family protein [Candidatus Woesearchaeota archaeon]|nr:dienelactone hydrolase family protein [Candidatus Woesearchaeota archaeon]
MSKIIIIKSFNGIKTILISILLSIFLISCTQQPEHIVDQASQNQVKNVDILKNGNASGIATETVNYYGNANGFLAKPKKEGIYPAVVMVHEWWGLNDNIKEMARQLAAEGYVVLAVDMFDGKVGKDANEARELSSKVRNNPGEAIRNAKAAVEFLKKEENVDKDYIASIGWCFGGQWSLQLALNEEMAATVIYYGNLETGKEKLKVIKWPVLGIFGEKDTSIPVESARKFDAALDELGIENEIYIYPNVGHAFANPSGANYAPKETKDAWEKTLKFLEKNLKTDSKIDDKIPQEDNIEIKEDYCEKDSDCVPDKCCHPSKLVNKKFAPKCDGAICTAVCSGPLDCRQWKAICKNNVCTVDYD